MKNKPFDTSQLINMFISNSFYNLLEIDRTLLDKLPEIIAKKYRVPKDEALFILEEWKLENPITVSYINNKEVFLKEAKSYDDNLRKKNIKPDTELLQRLAKWVSEIDFKKDENSFFLFCRRCFIFEYISLVYIDILEPRIQGEN